MTPWTIAGLLAVTADYLAAKGCSSACLDAELLLAQTLGMDRVSLYTEFDRPLGAEELDAYRELVARRARREPVAYILGHAAFRYLDLQVTPAVLIPRPETEELVDTVLAWLRTRPLLPAEPATPAPPRIADVGTGSGAIALSLASEAGLSVLALDNSAEALAVASANAERLGLAEKVMFRQGDLLEGVPAQSLRVVVSNPPYVSQAEFGGLEPDVRDHEPAGALLAGADGLQAYRRLVPQAAEALAPGGAQFLEVGADQATAVVALARGAGFAHVDIVRDLSGKERIMRAVMPGAAVLSLDEPDTGDVAALAGALAAGAVVGLPTDTVYGLAAAWDSAAGVRRLFEAKGRAGEQPIAVLFPSVEAIQAALPDLDDAVAPVLAALLPGPFTFIVATAVPRAPLVGTADSLGVRVPDHPALLGFLAELGVPLAATSANASGLPAPARREEVDPALLAYVAAALETSGPEGEPLGTASTVVDLRPLRQGETPVVLREGEAAASAVVARIDALLAAIREPGGPAAEPLAEPAADGRD